MIRSKPLQAAHKQISGINITPFTDVCLVLLIIFMVTANMFNENALHIILPKASPVQPVKQPTPVTVYVKYVDANHAPLYYVDDPINSISPAELASVLKLDKAQKNNTEQLIVKSDAKVPYQYIITAIDKASQVGLVKVSLSTQLDKDATPL